MASLLFLAQRIPYPPNKGEKIRSFNLLRHVARDFDVHLGCLVDDPADHVEIPAVAAICKTAHLAVIDRRQARLACLAGLLTGDALSVRYFHHRGLRHWIARTLDEVRPDIILVSSGNMAPYVLDQPYRARLSLCDLVDVDSAKFAAYGARAHGPMAFIHRREAGKIAALETRIARDFDWTTLVSEPEAELLRARVPERAGLIMGLPNGVDHGFFDPATPYPPPFAADMPTFVFTGHMDYAPNIDGVDWFARDILPMIRTRLGRARFVIVGANPSPAVVRLGDIADVVVTGRVPDVRPYLAHATAAVAPLRVARGLQNKVLEAMAMARPTIVTPCALEGIDALPGRDLILAGEPIAIAEAAVGLASDPVTGAAIGQAARARVVAHYGWAARLAAFDRLLQGGTVAG